MTEKKKGFVGKLLDKLDKKMEKKAKSEGCCCCGDETNEECSK